MSTGGASASASASASAATSNEAVHPSTSHLTTWTARPELWFAQAEAVFQERSPPVTNNKSKYNMVLRVLPNEVLEKIEHVITGQSQVGGQYLALKNALIDSYGRTEASKHTQLIALTKEGALGDRKPMDFLMYMRSLSGLDYETWE